MQQPSPTYMYASLAQDLPHDAAFIKNHNRGPLALRASAIQSARDWNAPIKAPVRAYSSMRTLTKTLTLIQAWVVRVGMVTSVSMSVSRNESIGTGPRLDLTLISGLPAILWEVKCGVSVVLSITHGGVKYSQFWNYGWILNYNWQILILYESITFLQLLGEWKASPSLT